MISLHSLRRLSVLTPLLILPSLFTACDGGSDDDPLGGAPSTGGVGGDSSASGGSGSVDVDTTPHTYPATDAKIQYVGRFDTVDPEALVFSAPAAQMSIRFAGDSVTALLEDEFKWGNNRNFYDVWVDGKLLKKVWVEKKTDKELELVRDLSPGEHTLTLVKRTEASIGQGTFRGFRIGGELLPPSAKPSRKMAFIGDSITAGAGVEAKNNSPECSENPFFEAGNGGWGQPYHNSNMSYGPVAARLLNAQYHVTAVSGIGLIRNYQSRYDARPMPEVYDLIFTELDKSMEVQGEGGASGLGGSMSITDERWLWDTKRYVPDVVVVALGTNDFSPGHPDEPREDMDVDAWVTACISFLQTLQGYYPNATYVLSQSPMLGNGWPDPDDRFRDDQWAALEAVVAHFHDVLGEERVHAVTVDKVPGGGCGTHPSLVEQEAIGTKMAADIAAIMNWE